MIKPPFYRIKLEYPLSWNGSFDNIEQKIKFPEKGGAATVSATKKYTTRRVVPGSWENYRHHYIFTFRA